MRRLFLVVLRGAGDGVQGDGGEEEQQERERERVLVQFEHQSTPADRPGNVLLTPAGLRLPIDRLRFIQLLRLGRALLVEHRGENHVPEHLDELAFPVFRRSLPEMSGSKIRTIVHLLLPMLTLLAVVLPMAHDALAHPEYQKQQDQDDTQSILAKDSSHGASWLDWGTTDRSTVRPGGKNNLD